MDSKNDRWRIYTFARHRLFDAIGENNISGVLYMSGDVNRSRVWTHPESDRVGYPLIEVISSGVANSKTLSYATVDFDTTSADPTVRFESCMEMEKSMPTKLGSSRISRLKNSDRRCVGKY